MDNVAFNSITSDSESGYLMLDTIIANETGPSLNCAVAKLEQLLEVPRESGDSKRKPTAIAAASCRSDHSGSLLLLMRHTCEWPPPLQAVTIRQGFTTVF
jgi:hypothetical protein